MAVDEGEEEVLGLTDGFEGTEALVVDVVTALGLPEEVEAVQLTGETVARETPRRSAMRWVLRPRRWRP